MTEQKHTGCCEPFDPAKWDQKEVTWDKKRFIEDKVTSVFHIPVNIKQKITKNVLLAKNAGAVPDDFIMLFDEYSQWGSKMYLAVNKDVPGAQMTTFSGTYLTKVYEGPYKNAGIWAKDMQGAVEKAGHKVKKIYFYYTTCPKCAKEYGKNYVVLFAQVE